MRVLFCLMERAGGQIGVPILACQETFYTDSLLLDAYNLTSQLVKDLRKEKFTGLNLRLIILFHQTEG